MATTTRPRPLLMTPLRRCGSHALRLRLNFSPEFYSPYPLHIVDFMDLVPLYGDLQVDENYFRLIVDVIGLQNASMVKWDDVVFNPVAIFDAIKNERRSVQRVVWELLFQAGAKNNARVVMDKSLDSVHYAEELVALFDDMLFLNVVRDPRAQVASMNRAIIHDFDTALNALTWLKAHEAGRRLAARWPQRVLTIRYEDFLEHQETVLRAICEFIGIGYLDSMVDISRSREAQQIAGLSALWESNYSAPIKANVDKFKQSLSTNEIEIIETLTGELMQYYGYERMTPGAAALTREEVDARRAASDARRLEAWAELKRAKYQDYWLRRFRADYLGALRERLSRGARTHERPAAAARVAH